MASEKANALLDYVNEDAYDEPITVEHEDAIIMLSDGSSYAVYTEDEAREEVKQYVMEYFGYFLPDFIAGVTGLPEAMFDGNSEYAPSDVNALLEAVGSSINEFVSEAIEADGIGHFLSGYDGQEINLGNFYAYRQD